MMKTRHLSAAGLALLLVGTVGTAGAATPAKPAPKPAAAAPAATADVGRDWNRIDTNRDGLISPEEMEQWLAANPGPLKK